MGDFAQTFDGKLLSNILTIILLTISVGYLLILSLQKKKRNYLLNMHVEKKKTNLSSVLENLKSIKNFKNELEVYLQIKDKGHLTNQFFIGIITGLILIAIALMAMGQYFVAIVYPLIIFWFMRKAMRLSKVDKLFDMENDLPIAIDNMVRVFSKYSDIKNIIFETAQTTKGALREELDLLGRQMNTKNPERVLEEFSEKYTSVWINSFALTILGYLRDSSKEETINNLRHLREILNNENNTKKDAISDRKPGIMINYTLVGLAIFAGVANIVFNPKAFDFFFNTYTGLFCFSAGFFCILGTIYMNIKMLKIEK